MSLAIAITGCARVGAETCGDGICPAGLACVTDDRSAMACAAVQGFLENGACRLCVLPTCGNGVVESGETCDDGNTVSGDGCPATCGPSCGDGILDPGEQCDDGNTVSGDGCAGDCQTDERCGNGILDLGESCDDGNRVEGDGCSSRCEAEAASWLDASLHPSVRIGAAMAYDARRGVTVLFGGCISTLFNTCNGSSVLADDTWEWDGAAWRQIATSSQSLPTARFGHAMAFDPDRGQVVMYGGCGGADVDLISCPNPLRDTWTWDGAAWTHLTTTAAPRASSKAAMVYDGGRRHVMLFGGCATGAGEPCTGDDSTWILDGNTWSEVVTALKPPGRWGHAMAFDPTRGVTVMFGGMTETNAFADTWEWSGTAWQARSPVTAPPGRAFHAMAFDLNLQRVVAFAGSDVTASGAAAGARGDLWTWDGGTWAPLATADAFARTLSASAYDAARRRLVVFGGRDPSRVLLDDTLEWTGDAMDVRSSQQLPVRLGGVMVYDAAEAVTLATGGDFAGRDTSPYTWRWNGQTWRFDADESAPTELDRVEHGATYDAARDRVVAFGGTRLFDGAISADTWELDGKMWLRLTPATAPSARRALAMVYDPVRARVVMFGGCTTATIDCGPLGDTWEWDGTTWSQQTPSMSPPARGGHALAFDPVRNVVVLFGGYAGTTPLGDTWTWDGTTWREETPASAPPARGRHAMASEARGVLLFGGCAVAGMVAGGIPCAENLGDTWMWNGTAWVNQATSGPPARFGHGMALDPLRGVVVLAGGGTGSGTGLFPCHDVWEWDGSAWSRRGPREPHGEWGPMTYDHARARVVMFTGSTWEWDGERWLFRDVPGPPAERTNGMAYAADRGVSVLVGVDGDVWEWDGVAWHQRASPGSGPSQRVGPAIAYDGHQVLLFGGEEPDGTFDDDLWAWDGTRWRALSTPMLPSARVGAAIAYDPVHHATLLFGGYDRTITDLADTWLWDGASWRSVSPATAPLGRNGAAMVFDPVRGKTLLYGGYGYLQPNSGGEQPEMDSWEWDGAAMTWTRVPTTEAGVGSGPIAYDEARKRAVLRHALEDDDTWFFRYAATLPDPVCRTGFTGSGAELAGCAAADCAAQCGTCGDGTCDPLESCRSCPADCGICDTCGDLHCDPTERCTTCPGDCHACP